MAFDIRETAFKLPENWKLVRLGDIAKVNEKSLTKKSQPDFIRYIDISSVSTGAFDTPKLLKKDEIPSRAKRILRNNDFIISTVRPNLKQFSFIEEAQENLIASTGFCVISSNNSKLAWYLYSLITSDLFTEYLVKIADGGAYPAFNPKEIEDAIIPLPDKDNLEFISDTSRFFHKKIQLNTQINQILEQIAQALFKSWFVDFDPVRAKVQALSDGLSLEQAELAAMQAISGKTPEELTALSQTQPERYAELAETTKAFPCEMVEIDGVEVPKGWRVSTISECSLKIQNGGTPKRSNLEYWENGEIPWLSSGEVCNNKVLVQSKEYITDLALKGSTAKLIPPYSTLVAIYASPTAGKCAFSGFETSTNQAVCAIIPKEEYTFFNYYHLQLQEKYFANQASGSAQQNISKKIIEETPVLIPNKVILKKFNLLAKPIMNKTIENLKENNNLERKRDLLLPKLLNGEV